MKTASSRHGRSDTAALLAAMATLGQVKRKAKRKGAAAFQIDISGDDFGAYRQGVENCLPLNRPNCDTLLFLRKEQTRCHL